MSSILAVGIATLDIINTVDNFPAEDAEVSACSQQQVRGGNATNTLTVLSQLGHDSHWAGTLIDEPDSQIIQSELAKYHINTQACTRLSQGKMPTSYITLNKQSGSRTIVHHRDCPEFSFAAFKKINLQQFDWIHFEGRNIEETELMLRYLKQYHPDIPCSIEIEKPRDNIETLFPYASVLFFSHHYAQAQGFNSAEALLNSLPADIKASCTWGNEGAWAIDSTNTLIHAPIYPPENSIDTLGAGDTFNAAMIHQLSNNTTLTVSLDYASQLAGHKCGQYGFANLTQQFKCD
ncbi:MAG: ketohexokinase [Gammaproteobacteria bacterium]|nr:MAG: ketohexokinase [Gammaproteobacteria bacterium]